MKTRKYLLLPQLLFIQLTLCAQVQWYQNQDGNNQPPNGTVGTSVQQLTPKSFIACYQWNVSNDVVTWKISKTHINGTEQRCFFISGITAMAEVKAGNKKSVYVLTRNFPFGQNPEYKIYKLDTNLNVTGQRTIEFPNGFSIFNLNAFEIDGNDNLYFAGDGQYPDGPGFSPGSFVMKTDKNLITKWSRMDSSQTSFTRLHVDQSGNLWVVADFYTFFPEIRLSKLNANGIYTRRSTIQGDPGRFNLYSTLDKDQNLLLYGGKSVSDTTQAIYLYRISKTTGSILYNKTHFISAGTQLYDLKVDHEGNIFSIVSQYFGPDNQVSKISRIKVSNGSITWNRSFYYTEDSCNLFKLVINQNDRFFVVGEKRSSTYFSKGFMLRMKKNGQTDGNFAAPDSVCFQRSHWLVDGISNHNDQLIAIGNTQDLDTTIYTSTYLRAFAVMFNNSGCNENTIAATKAVTEETTFTGQLSVYPNPVQQQLNVSNLTAGVYNKLVIYDIKGNMLLQQEVKSNTARIDVNSLPDGVYLLVAHRVSGEKESVKFVVRK